MSLLPLHRDSAQFALKNLRKIPITIMFDLLYFEDRSKIDLYQSMLKVGYDIGVFIDYTSQKRFEENINNPVFLKGLKEEFKTIFKRDLKFVYLAWTTTTEQSRILKANGLRSVLASFDFSDSSYSALDIAEYRAIDPNQRSFIVVPDTHRPDGDPLVEELADIFYQADFDIVPLSECLDAPLDNYSTMHDL